jgi:hypothetical protein
VHHWLQCMRPHVISDVRTVIPPLHCRTINISWCRIDSFVTTNH